ncbi:hypothetical protein [Pedobacter ginsengisoli]|uniref:hypothetical protein n=1 Tax=Pedobacter ginsengisoli TaxID=363852 RepID=UPI00254D64EA|nr:hypothetical protein [Pedobacter ginsengisoli]
MYNTYTIIKDEDEDRQLLKKIIWLYLLLLIFEGALRKWFLPFLSSPLLIIRDPIAIWLIYKVWSRGLLPSSTLLNGMVVLASIGIVTAIVFGHGNLFVAGFGARIFLIQFPMIFVIARVFDKEDVIAVGRLLAWIAIPMTALIILQFYSAQSAFVNRGVGGIEGSGFSGALGYFRPSGTFSFTNGTHLFFGLVASYLFYFWFTPGQISRFILYASTIAVLVAIPFSISRSLAFQVAVSLIFALFAVVRRPENLFRVLMVGIIVSIIVVILLNLDFLQNSIDAFVVRFTTASNIEGGLGGTIVDRYFGKMISALETALDQPFFGYGMGMGTNVGSALLTGSRKFLIAEEEWARLIGELGPFLGLSVIFIRLALSIKMTIFSYYELRIGNMLPWMLLGYVLTSLPRGQWAQPTSLGFSVMVAGLLIAGMKKPQED